ncbi:MAG: NAD(+) kinase [Gammaproteobacteria bacterium]|nr:NAD(+) kinase [Gammaproteobacteria bacterium]MDE0367008.1 NAD(+) kinase [Gammaproteobacteria bacterium]
MAEKRQNTKNRFAAVGLIGRPGTQVADSLQAVIDCLAERGLEIVVEDRTAGMLGNAGQATADRPSMGRHCDLVVVVGGDGSLLGVGRDLAHTGVPVLGINRGGLGFLADISPERIHRQLGEVLDGEYRVEDHFLLEAGVFRGDERIDGSPALNDVVVHPGSMARMMEFSLEVDGEFVYDQRSDGLIVASPTGSTAYALSAGGPIMHPSLDAIVIVPMFPHTLTSRPLVVRGTSEIAVTLGTVDRAKVNCDSQVDFDLESGDTVRIRKYATPLRLLYTYGHSFYESCRSKLDWASRLGGRD